MKWQVIKNRVRRGLRRTIVYGIYLTIVFFLGSFLILQIPAVQQWLVSQYLRDLHKVVGFNITAGSL